MATAIAAVITVAALALWQGSHPFAMRSASEQFDAALVYARSLAKAGGNGATMVFAPRTDAAGDTASGFVLRVYSGRPTSAAAMQAAPMAAMSSAGDVSEDVLGAVPFTIFLDSAGHASAMVGVVTIGSILASDPGCPTGENAVTLRFSDARSHDTRTIACSASRAGAPLNIPPIGPG